MVYPPYAEFATFIQELALDRNDPNLILDTPEKKNTGNRYTGRQDEVNVKKTGVQFKNQEHEHNKLPARNHANWCIIHNKPHPFSKCGAFQVKPLEERTRILRQHRLCFRCIASRDHFAKNCKAKTVCSICKSDKHVAALHADVDERNGGESRDNQEESGNNALPQQDE